MKVFNAFAILAVLLLATLGGAAAVATYQVPVATFDASTNAKLTVDYIAINDAAGNEVGRFTNVQHAAFVLDAVGEYVVIAHKTGYADIRADVFVEADGPSKLPTLNIKLTPTAPPQPPSDGTGGTDNTGGTGGTGGTSGTQSTGILIKDLDFEDEAKPNQDVEFTVELKNTWVVDGKGVDASEVTVHLTLKGIDDGSDVTEDLEFGAIDYKDTEEESVTLQVPLDADDKDYTVEAIASWENEDGRAFQSAAVTKKLSVERADHDVAFTNVDFESDAVDLNENSQVAVSLANIGKDDETVRVTLRSDALGLSVTSPEFKLRESKETTQYLPFSVAKDVKAGKYPITVTVSFGSESASQTSVLTINPKATTQVQQPVTVVPVATTVQETAASQPQETVRQADTNLLAGFGVLVLILIIVAFIMAGQNQPVVVEKKRGGK